MEINNSIMETERRKQNAGKNRNSNDSNALGRKLQEKL